MDFRVVVDVGEILPLLRRERLRHVSTIDIASGN